MGSKELKKSVVGLIEDKKSEAGISSISVWEALILAEKGRLSCSKDEMIDIAKEASLNLGLREIPITSEIAILSRELEFKHQDPADRFICATTRALNAKLLTRDKEILKLKWLSALSV